MTTAASGLAVLAAVCGAAVAAGLVLIAAGLRRAPVPPQRTWSPPRVLRGVRGLPALGGVGERRRLLAALAAGILAWSVTGWPVAAASAGIAVLGLPRLLSQASTRRQLDRLEALEAWIRRVADLLAAGAGGLEQAITASARTCPPPIAGEVAALVGRLRMEGPEPALRSFADDLADAGSSAPDLVAAALILRVRRGGRGLRPVLHALAGDVAELVRARRAIEAERAKPRQNVRVLLAITAVVGAAMLGFARDFLAPFGTPAGQLMLAVIAGVFGCGVWWLARIARPLETPRFLPATASPGTSPAAAAFRASSSGAAGTPIGTTPRGRWWG
jgi:Flp pilus assembly protein TadB